MTAVSAGVAAVAILVVASGAQARDVRRFISEVSCVAFPLNSSQCCTLQRTADAVTADCANAGCCEYCIFPDSECPRPPGAPNLPCQFHYKACSSCPSTPPDVPACLPTSAPPPPPPPPATTPQPPPPASEPSCMSGSARVDRVSPTSGRIERAEVRDLEEGDIVLGVAGDELTPATCTVEAIGDFGVGAVYGDYTDHHYLLDPGSRTVVTAGTRNQTATVVDKYIVLLGDSVNTPPKSCLAGKDSNSNLYTPIDSDFCGPDVSLSFEQYKMLYTMIVRTVRASGGFWLSKATYTTRAMPVVGGPSRPQHWREFTPRLCRSMLQCASSGEATSEACARYEATGAEFVAGFMTTEARETTLRAFPRLGEPGVNGSASFAAMDSSSDDGMQWHTAAGIAAAVLLVVAVMAAATVAVRRRRRSNETAQNVTVSRLSVQTASGQLPWVVATTPGDDIVFGDALATEASSS